MEGEPIDRSRGKSSNEAIGYAILATAVTVIDRSTGSAGRLYPSAVHVVLVKQ